MLQLLSSICVVVVMVVVMVMVVMVVVADDWFLEGKKLWNTADDLSRP